MVVSKRWTLAKEFQGKPVPENFKLVEEDLPEKVNDGEFLCETVCLTVDPYMRAMKETGTKVGDTMFGEQIAKVIVSKNPKYPVGSLVRNVSGWRTHFLVTDPAKQVPAELPELGDLPPSLTLGVMGMPGMTAYFGFLEICQPKEGEVVLVSGAAGAVGSLVGQIAKIKGCKVIGFAGDDRKCDWIKNELGFDHVFNYKKVDIDESLKKAAPDGIDCYFDNVGGDFSVKAWQHMKVFGRISICGSIANYNSTSIPMGPLQFLTILGKQLKVEGFIVTRWRARWHEGEKQMKEWIQQGQIKYKESITKGFENMPKAFMGLFEGSNFGKAIITC